MSDDKKLKRLNIFDTWDGEYHGNVFGNKVAIRGGIFLLILLAFMIYRHVKLDVPFGGDAPVPAPTEEVISPSSTQ